ncbi:MAG TPA: response regulator [Stellaceae bacterium]|nr:response regulator [Stellaceae bacterium]
MIDDQPAVRTVVQTALEEDGAFRVSGASTGDDALARFDSDVPDLIVLDLVMPGMHGLELAAHALARGIPVVLMTGEPTMTATLESLACPHLHKPFRMEQLLAEARAAIEDAAANRHVVRRALHRLLAGGDAGDALLQRVRTILEQAED